MRHFLGILAAVTLSAGALAQPLPECGTTEARQRQVEELSSWSAARQRQAMFKSGQILAKSSVKDSLVMLDADETTAPFRRPFDLEGRSLLFTRKNETTFVRQNIDLAWDDMNGAVSKNATASGPSSYTLPFSFPFFSTSLTAVSLTSTNAIFASTVPTIRSQQLNDAELAAVNVPVISPLLMTSSIMGSNLPGIQVKEFGDRVSISWTVSRTSLSYDVQATLFSNGNIRFSYKSATAVPAGGVVITSGSEGWREQKTLLVASDDNVDDVNGSPSATLRPLLDINSVSVSRVAGSNLIELRLKVGGARSQLASGESASYTVFLGDSALRQYVSFTASANGSDSFYVPVWGSSSGSPAARMENDTIVMDILQDSIAGPLSNLSIRAYSQAPNATQWADWLYVTANLDPPSTSVRTDFHALSSDESQGPIEEAFTLPVLSVGGVWSQLKQAYGLSDGQYDAVAIYQNFLTDLILYAGAYSSGGNPAVSGIKLGSTSTPGSARVPNLLHMNEVGYSWNATTDNSGHVILHEFGHRWLLQVGIMENGSTTRALNPLSSHPAQYVHTPAANRVVTTTDGSVMGGANWTDNQNGTFTSPAFSNFSYSWLDLYLMGLADKSEVPPFFYIADSDPKLGSEYYPPASSTFKGTRKEVTIDQVIEGTGVRNPAYPYTQRHFNVLFVLLTNPDRPVTADEIDSVTKYRKLFEQRFATATGGRADVSTTFTLPLSAPRRRAIGH